MVVYLPIWLNQLLASVGIVILLFGFVQITRFMMILRDNNYSIVKWILIQVLILFFIAGYTLHLIVISTDLPLFIDIYSLVTAIYFGGGIFVISVLYFINSTITSILGERLTDEQAIQKFHDEFGKVDKKVLVKRFSLECEVCKENYDYSIVDIIRNNAKSIQKGIVVNSTFGVRNFVLRPTHKCTDGRREITVIHDKDLEYRSTDNSRIVISGDL